MLHCAARTARPSGSAALIPWTQGKLSHLIATEEAAGSSHLTPAITPPLWPCLYLKVQQEVLM